MLLEFELEIVSGIFLINLLGIRKLNVYFVINKYFLFHNFINLCVNIRNNKFVDYLFNRINY